ncbi:hypothetical protein GCM10027436_44250 [Actinophytocola sediminis]
MHGEAVEQSPRQAGFEIEVGGRVGRRRPSRRESPGAGGPLLESVVIALVLLTIVIGVAASLWPARKVAERPILTAIQSGTD